MLDIISVETDYGLLSIETFSTLSGLVSHERREKTARIRHKQTAVNTLMSEVVARTAICVRMGIKNEELEMQPDEHGKPHPVNLPGVHYNVSHSGNLVVCAVDDSPVGIDVELIKAANLRVAERYFCGEENRVQGRGACCQKSAISWLTRLFKRWV